MKAFIDFLAAMTDLSPDFVQAVTKGISRERYKARQIIQGLGQVETCVWFIKAGLARSYIYDEHGNQHTIRFWYQHELIFSYNGFLKQPATEYTDLLADCELYSCTYDFVAEMLRHYAEAMKIAGVVNRHFQEKENFRNQLHSMRSRERYLLFRKAHPEIFTQVPQWIIASYLHMTRENLSRIISEE